eukprot:COSAG01_NODE_1430_length_10325_cov_7.452376_8_plen_274_part_00
MPHPRTTFLALALFGAASQASAQPSPSDNTTSYSDYCTGNTDEDAEPDVNCPVQISTPRSHTLHSVKGRTVLACCQFSGACHGNTDTKAEPDIECNSTLVPRIGVAGASVKGRDVEACCEPPSSAQQDCLAAANEAGLTYSYGHYGSPGCFTALSGTDCGHVFFSNKSGTLATETGAYIDISHLPPQHICTSAYDPAALAAAKAGARFIQIVGSGTYAWEVRGEIPCSENCDELELVHELHVRCDPSTASTIRCANPQRCAGVGGRFAGEQVC